MSSIDRELEELIQADIDGLISAENRLRLQARLESDAQARTLHEDLQWIGSALDETPEMEPPAWITSEVMNAIPSSGDRDESESLVSRLLDWFTLPAMRYAFAFVAGVLLTSGVMQMPLDNNTVDVNATVTGTMSPISIAPTLQSYQLDESDLQGKIELSRVGQWLQFNFSLDSAEPVELLMSFDEQDYSFTSFSQVHNEVTSFRVDGGDVALLVNGAQHFSIQLRDMAAGDSNIVLNFDRGEETIEAVTIRPGETDPG